jgi:hypothetical protein
MLRAIALIFSVPTISTTTPAIVPLPCCPAISNASSTTPEAIYPNPDAAFAAIQAYAKDQGYAFKKGSNRPNKRVYSCDHAGKYNPRGKDLAVHKSKQRTSTGSKKCGC